MSTDQTSALARAAEAILVVHCDPGPAAHEEARAAVSAVLHDPADDVIARTLIEHTRTSGIHGDCSCGHVVPLGHSFAAHQADAVRAAILGNDQ